MLYIFSCSKTQRYGHAGIAVAGRGLPYQSDKIQTELIKSPVLKQIFWKRGGFGKLCMFLENL